MSRYVARIFVGSGHSTNEDRQAPATVQALVILKRIGSTYLPSLISSMKARPACFCKEFCHSCEQSSITNSTTELLFLNVVNPTTQISPHKKYIKHGTGKFKYMGLKREHNSLQVSQQREFTPERKDY